MKGSPLRKARRRMLFDERMPSPKHWVKPHVYTCSMVALYRAARKEAKKA